MDIVENYVYVLHYPSRQIKLDKLPAGALRIEQSGCMLTWGFLAQTQTPVAA